MNGASLRCASRRRDASRHGAARRPGRSGPTAGPGRVKAARRPGPGRTDGRSDGPGETRFLITGTIPPIPWPIPTAVPHQDDELDSNEIFG